MTPLHTRDLAQVQARTVRLLMLVEIITGLGVAMGITAGALLTQEMAGTELSGVAQSGAVIGAALMAIPASALMQRSGRRPGLALCYTVGAVGGLAVLAAAAIGSIPLLFFGFFLFGSASAGKLSARYAAVDLAVPERRARSLSLVVWSTTVGAVLGPLLVGPLGHALPGNLPFLAAPFAFASSAFLIGALLILAFMRPDPLLLAGGTTRHGDEPRPSMRAAWEAVLASPGARLGIAATSVGHLVMVAVMSMTPLHIKEIHPQEGTLLRVVGIVISAHIAGMYAVSPIVGWLTDKLGRRPIILTGVVLLVSACALAGTAGHGTPQLTLALTMLGVGWSCTMVAGSTLLAESIPQAVKARAQGLSDLATGLTGASAGLVSGIIVGLSGYPALTLIASIMTIPLVALALRPVAPAAPAA